MRPTQKIHASLTVPPYPSCLFILLAYQKTLQFILASWIWTLPSVWIQLKLYWWSGSDSPTKSPATQVVVILPEWTSTEKVAPTRLACEQVIQSFSWLMIVMKEPGSDKINLGCIRKISKSLSRIPQWLLSHFLPYVPTLTFRSDCVQSEYYKIKLLLTTVFTTRNPN